MGKKFVKDRNADWDDKPRKKKIKFKHNELPLGKNKHVIVYDEVNFDDEIYPR